MASRRPVRDDEVPEADALEQAMPLDDPGAGRDDDDVREPFPADAETRGPITELPADVPEADALEQATPAGDIDDEWPDREE
jgi:hypothetical protein